MNIIRAVLEGTSNTRDIGGYVGNNGRAVKWRKVLRSDGLDKLTDKDQDILKEKYNLKKVIDLRTKYEISKNPNIDYSAKHIEYVNIPLADEINPNTVDAKGISKLDDRFLVNLYIDILDNKQNNVKKVIEEIADIGENECVLFHCTAGKDRTGIVTMLLLGICGVDKQDIITNYMQTEINLKYNEAFIENMDKLNINLPEKFVNALKKSDPEFMEFTHDYFISKYGNFYDYFILLGFTKEFIFNLQKELTFEI